MKEINLRELYPNTYKTDTYVEVSDDVLETIKAHERAEAARERKMYRYKAHYSLDRGDGIEHDALYQPLTPEEIVLEQTVREKLYAAIMELPEKQAKRIYAHFYLGMSKAEIARQEGVAESAIRESISRGLQHLTHQIEQYR